MSPHEIDLDALEQALASGSAGRGVMIVDVREASEFSTGSLPGARSIPSGEIRARHYEMPRGSTVYLVCANGARSLDLVPFLRAVGVDAWSVHGGLWAWLQRGRTLDGSSTQP